jgi:hypothetical protein
VAGCAGLAAHVQFHSAEHGRDAMITTIGILPEHLWQL